MSCQRHQTISSSSILVTSVMMMMMMMMMMMLVVHRRTMWTVCQLETLPVSVHHLWSSAMYLHHHPIDPTPLLHSPQVTHYFPVVHQSFLVTLVTHYRAEYYDEHVCVSVCYCLYPSASVLQEPHLQTSPNLSALHYVMYFWFCG